MLNTWLNATKHKGRSVANRFVIIYINWCWIDQQPALLALTKPFNCDIQLPSNCVFLFREGLIGFSTLYLFIFFLENDTNFDRTHAVRAFRSYLNFFMPKKMRRTKTEHFSIWLFMERLDVCVCVCDSIDFILRHEAQFNWPLSARHGSRHLQFPWLAC